MEICAERGQIIERLKDLYGEYQIGIGLQENRSAVEVFLNPTFRTWTFALTTPNGTTCLIASGQYWEVTNNLPINNDPAT